MIINPYQFGIIVPEPSSRWKFNGNGTDEKGVADLTFGAGVTANADHYNITTAADNYFTTANGTYGTLTSYTIVHFFQPNTTTHNSRFINIGTGDNTTNGTLTAYMTLNNSQLDYVIANASSAVTTLSLTGISLDTSKQYMAAVTYSRVGGAADNVMTSYLAEAGSSGTLITNTRSDAVLQRQAATHELHSRANIGAVGGISMKRYDLRIWEGTILTQAEISALCDRGEAA